MKLPVTVIGGYLGSGKTTLVNHLLRHNDGLRLAVLVNEFGDLPIDADLIQAEEDGLISISGGCVCCAFGSDLLGALEDLCAMDPGPDHVLIEASGVALPASIAATVGMIEGLRADAVVVLADVDQIQANAVHKYLSDTIERQLAQADILLLTKTDLATDAEVATVTDWLGHKAGTTRILPVRHGALPASALLGALPLPARHNGQSGGHGHTLFASTTLTPTAPVDAEALGRALACDATVTRAKGFVDTGHGLALVHVVGARHSTEKVQGQHVIGLVCIGPKDGFDPDALHALVA